MGEEMLLASVLMVCSITSHCEPPEPFSPEPLRITINVPQPQLKSYPLETYESQAYRMGNGTTDVEQWRPLVAGQFPPEQVENALCIIRHESGGEPHIRNLAGSNARGLFQIMTSVWADNFGFTYEDFYVPELNVYAAARIWESSGWRPWSSRHKCGL